MPARTGRGSLSPSHPLSTAGPPRRGAGRYLGALRLPGAAAFFTGSLPIRFGLAMLELGLVLLVRADTGSFALAGTVTAAWALAGTVGGPLMARLSDRFGQRRSLPLCLSGHLGAVAALIGCVHGGAPHWLWFVLAAVAGGVAPPVGALTRARWSALTPVGSARTTAFALEGMTDDLSFTIGPAVVAVLAGAVLPVSGPLLAVALVAVGGVALVACRRTAPPPHPPAVPGAGRRAGTLLGPLRYPGMWLLMVTLPGVGAVFSGLQVTLSAVTTAAGRPALAGVIYAGFSGASVLSGLGYGALRWRSGGDRRLRVAYAGLAVGLLPLPLLAGAGLVSLAIGVVLPGLALAPTLIAANDLAGALVPARVRTEAFAWLAGASGLGLAFGAVVTGRLVDATDPRYGFLVPAAVTMVAALALAAGRRWLQPAGAAAV